MREFFISREVYALFFTLYFRVTKFATSDRQADSKFVVLID